jgi:hypothetical protein
MYVLSVICLAVTDIVSSHNFSGPADNLKVSVNGGVEAICSIVVFAILDL